MTVPALQGLRIVLGDRTLRYLKGGGHWAVRVQHLIGLRDLGCDVSLLEVWQSSGNQSDDARQAAAFFDQLKEYDLHNEAAVAVFDGISDLQDLETATVYGRSKDDLVRLIDRADLLWNLAASIRNPLLSRFKRKALLDVDPGILQVSAKTVEMDLGSHDAFLTVGSNMRGPGCEAPNLGLDWTPFLPPIYLPLWEVAPDPGAGAPVSTVTHWNWQELHFEGRVLSLSKRAAYLRYATLPVVTNRPFTLAAHIPERDRLGDRALLEGNGWSLVDPREAVRTLAAYKQFIADSRAEISCPKPVYRELGTGWFSDRTACYLASGRPVLAEDTGFTNHLPTGDGLFAFNDVAEAADAVREIDANYGHHMRAARRFAEEFLDSRKVLPEMLRASL